MPADVTGSSIWNQRDADFEFRAGRGLRQPSSRRRDQPRAAEDAGRAARGDAGAAGDDGRRDHGTLERPFLVLATQNPIEYEGTYPLPEAQLDRFLLRTGFGYPAADDEWGMLERRARAPQRRGRAPTCRRPRDPARDAAAVEQVHVSESVGRYIVDARGGDAGEPERRGRREPARQPGRAQARPLPEPRSPAATS